MSQERPTSKTAFSKRSWRSARADGALLGSKSFMITADSIFLPELEARLEVSRSLWAGPSLAGDLLLLRLMIVEIAARALYFPAFSSMRRTTQTLYVPDESAAAGTQRSGVQVCLMRS